MDSMIIKDEIPLESVVKMLNDVKKLAHLFQIQANFLGEFTKGVHPLLTPYVNQFHQVSQASMTISMNIVKEMEWILEQYLRLKTPQNKV